MSQQINLFNPIFLKQKKYFSAVAMAQALGVLLLGSMLLVGYASMQASALNLRLAGSANDLMVVQGQLAKVSADYGPRKKSKALEDEIQKAETDVKALQTVFDILKKGEFGNTSGYSEYLRAFSRQSFDGVWLTGLSIVGAGNEIVIQGRALKSESVPLYISRLKHEPVMQGKSFASLEMQVQVPPQPDSPKKDAAGAKPKTAQGYIAFSLQSSAGKGEPVDAPKTGNK